MSDFIALADAAMQAYRGLIAEHERAHEQARLDAHLSYLAAELASILPVFSRIDGAAPEILPPQHVLHGKFTQGGRLLSLEGSREPVSGLCLRRADLDAAIEQLRRRIPRNGAWPRA